MAEKNVLKFPPHTRILITGSRTWKNEKAIYDVLSEFYSGYHRVLLVSGHAMSGADPICERIAKEFGWEIEKHPAEWELYGRAAGYIRNAEMVKLGADICLAFIKDHSKGASHTAKLSTLRGIETRIISEDGEDEIVNDRVA